MHVVSICFKCFQVFRTYVCKCFIQMLYMFAMVFKSFSGVFVSVSDARLKCFICLILYVATVASECFKSRSGVAHGMRVGTGLLREQRSGQRGRRLEWRGSTAGALTHEPDTLGARSLPARAASGR